MLVDLKSPRNASMSQPKSEPRASLIMPSYVISLAVGHEDIFISHFQ
jgi:hypothetical protein